VLQPLLDNAFDHARSRVTIEVADLADAVMVTVGDDGPGIPESLRDRLFDPGVTTTPGGAGLGLGIARRIARTIGAEIEVGTPASGAELSVTLPRA
jgi:signal transduction histidine kinase